MGSLCQQHEQVSRSISIVGGVYASRNRHMMQMSIEEQRDILASLRKQKMLIADEMRRLALSVKEHGNHAYQNDPSSGSFRSIGFSDLSSAILLCSQLLAVAELLIDPTGDEWRDWIGGIAEFVDRCFNAFDKSDPLTSGLLQLIRLSNVLSSLSRCELPLVSTQESSNVIPWVAEEPLSDSSLDNMIGILGSWAALQYR
jgi:hypothetical protein